MNLFIIALFLTFAPYVASGIKQKEKERAQAPIDIVSNKESNLTLYFRSFIVIARFVIETNIRLFKMIRQNLDGIVNNVAEQERSK